MSDIKEAFVNGWLKEDPRIVAAALLGIFAFVMLNILFHKSEKNKKEQKRRAIEQNNVVEADIVSGYHKCDSESNTVYYGRYRYTVNGKTREYRINSVNPLPRILKLYPRNSSMTKFFSDYDDITGAAIAFNVLAAIAVVVLVLRVSWYIF